MYVPLPRLQHIVVVHQQVRVLVSSLHGNPQRNSMLLPAATTRTAATQRGCKPLQLSGLKHLAISSRFLLLQRPVSGQLKPRRYGAFPHLDFRSALFLLLNSLEWVPQCTHSVEPKMLVRKVESDSAITIWSRASGQELRWTTHSHALRPICRLLPRKKQHAESGGVCMSLGSPTRV